MKDSRFTHRGAEEWFKANFPDYADKIEFDWGYIRFDVRRTGNWYYSSGLGGVRLENYNVECVIYDNTALTPWNERSALTRGRFKLSTLTTKKLDAKISKIDKGMQECIELQKRLAADRDETLTKATAAVQRVFPDFTVRRETTGRYYAEKNGRSVFSFYFYSNYDDIRTIKLTDDIPWDTAQEIIKKL